jgi:hypothetical protein
MKRAIAGTFVAAICAATLSAQSTPPQSQPMQESKDSAKAVTVSGCLKAGEGTDTFLLSDLKWAQDKAVGTSGAVTPAPPAISATSLKLIGSPSTKLSEHVGHQVEVTGTIGDKDAKAPSASDPASRPPAGAGAAPAFNVRTVRMVAATCSTK